jgi:hypothetical protein
MRAHIQLNPRNLSNDPLAPTYGFKIPIQFIRSLAQLDVGLASHLVALESGTIRTHRKSIALLWPLRNAAEVRVRVSYTYTGRPLAGGGYSSQGHIAITDATWTPWIVKSLGGSFSAEYFQGKSRDLIVISEP